MPVPPGDWTEPVIAFLRDHLPAWDDTGWQTGGWDHMFSTAYQIGCMALVGLGQADESVSGAVPKAEPQLPAVLPLWEDICVAVLWLAEQNCRITYRQMDGSLRVLQRKVASIRQIGAPPPRVPNILAGPGTGPALADEPLNSVLHVLGLVEAGRWTPAAEVVHWRSLPGDWRLSFDEDLRFLSAVEAAVTGMPANIRAEIDALMVISPVDIDAELAKEWLGVPPTLEYVRRSLPYYRQDKLDWLFYRRWRLAQGWLSADDTPRALEIFHDQLAIAMRKAVVAQLYPDGFVWT